MSAPFAVAALAAPLLIVHGERDAVVPVRHGRRLHARARSPKEAAFLPEAGHADLHDFGLPAIALDFLARHGLVPGSR